RSLLLVRLGRLGYLGWAQHSVDLHRLHAAPGVARARSGSSDKIALMKAGWLLVVFAALMFSQQKWPQADGKFTEFPLPNANSGPTTIAIAPGGMLWFTESNGDRIGRMGPDGTGLKEFPLPHQGSSPRIIGLGADK